MPDDPATGPDPASPQDDASRRTPTVPVRVPRVMWAAYSRVCDRLGTSRGADLLDHIRAQITAHGDEQDLADLAAGEAELAQRRSRLHTGRPRKRPSQK